MFSGILLLPVLGLENVTGQLFRPVIILFYYYMMVTFDFIQLLRVIYKSKFLKILYTHD